MRKLIWVLVGGLLLVGCQAEEEGEGESGYKPRLALATDFDLVFVGLPDSVTPVEAGNLGRDVDFAVTRNDTLFWCSAWDNLFGAYDVSDPSNPVPLFTLEGHEPYNGYGLFRVRPWGDLLFLCCKKGLAIYRLSGSEPQLLAFVDTLLARDCYRDGDYLYVTEERVGGGVYVLDISDPANPYVVGRPDSVLQWGDYLVKVGNYLYVSASAWDGEGELCVYDVSDPRSPRFVKNVLPEAEEVNGLYLKDNLLYAVGDAFYVIDVSDPANPQLLGSYKGDDYSNYPLVDLYVSGSYAYVAATFSSSGHVVVFDVSDSTKPVELGRADFGGLGGNSIAPLP